MRQRWDPSMFWLDHAATYLGYIFLAFCSHSTRTKVNGICLKILFSPVNQILSFIHQSWNLWSTRKIIYIAIKRYLAPHYAFDSAETRVTTNVKQCPSWVSEQLCLDLRYSTFPNALSLKVKIHWLGICCLQISSGTLPTWEFIMLNVSNSFRFL